MRRKKTNRQKSRTNRGSDSAGQVYASGEKRQSRGGEFVLGMGEWLRLQVQRLFKWLWRGRFGKLVVILISAAIVAFALWSNLPERYKNFTLSHIWPLSENEGWLDKSPIPSESVAQHGQETIVGKVMPSVPQDANRVQPDQESTRPFDFEPPEMVEIPERGSWIGKYEITNKQYSQFLAENADYKNPPFFNYPGFNDPDQPVVGVIWYEAKAYCDWLSRKTKDTYQLPTKDQWDAAAEYCGVNTYPGGTLEIDKRRVNIGKANDHPLRVHRLGGEETSLGIRDMGGNVAEWCLDEHQGEKVVRGGYWASQYDEAAYHFNAYNKPDAPKEYLGFRVVRLKRGPYQE